MCASCQGEAKGDPELDLEGDEELFGDPLVYATFVAPVQCSTDSSRQPSFNSSQPSSVSRQPSFNSRQPSFNSSHPSVGYRQPSFKQNSTEGELVPEVSVHFH